MSDFYLLGDKGDVAVQRGEVRLSHEERNHQSRRNVILVPRIEDRIGARDGTIQCRPRVGGMLRFYHRQEVA